MNTADAILRTLESPNVADSNFEPANVVDVLNRLSSATYKVASAITPLDAAPNHDETGGTVASLTEAVMGVTCGLCRIADAIQSLADAVSEREKSNGE
jgi:hypothetical protein